MRLRGHVELARVAITTGLSLLAALVAWVGSATWTRHEAVAEQARVVADHERRLDKVATRLEDLAGQVQRMEAASSRHLDAAARLEAAASRLEAMYPLRRRSP